MVAKPEDELLELEELVEPEALEELDELLELLELDELLEDELPSPGVPPQPLSQATIKVVSSQ
jgi:hypothetical protein